MHTIPETSREERRVINAIRDLSNAEEQIATCKTIEEVEEIRLRCQAIQFYDREHAVNMGPMLINWAKRCAVKCQLRITELQEIANGKKVERLLISSNFADKARRSEAKLVASLSPEELDKQLKTSGSVQLIARKVRKMRKKPDPKGTPEQLAKARARYFRNKEKKPGSAPLPLKRTPSKKFELYWYREQKLLQEFFGSDVSFVEAMWLKAFQSYRTEVEVGTRERNQALAKLKNTTARETDAGASDGK